MVRAHAERLGLPADWFAEHDVQALRFVLADSIGEVLDAALVDRATGRPRVAAARARQAAMRARA